jgi:hypothetical protein
LGLEGCGKSKNPMTSSGIEDSAFRLVANCFNQLSYHVPLTVIKNKTKTKDLNQKQKPMKNIKNVTT